MSDIIKQWLTSVRLQVGALAATYALFTDGFLLVRVLVGERWPLIALLNNFTHWILIVNALGFLAVWVAPYRRFWAAYAVPGLLVGVVWYGGLYIPWPVPDAGEGVTLTVATYNLGGKNGSREELAAAVPALGADIVGIQEFSGYLAIDWREELPTGYPYYHTENQVTVSNLAILSRYPIQSTEVVGQIDASRAVGLRAVVLVDERPISVYVAHFPRPEINVRSLAYDDQGRGRAAQALARAVRQDPNPVIVLCDCNMSDRTRDYGVLEEHLIDSWRERGFGLGLTGPSDGSLPLTLIRSDYVWHSEGMTALDAEVRKKRNVSDHYPVVVRLRLEN